MVIVETPNEFGRTDIHSRTDDAYEFDFRVGSSNIERDTRSIINIAGDDQLSDAAINRDKEYAKFFIENFSDRLLFGRDNYGSELIETINELELTKSAKENIFSINAMRLVKTNF